MDDGGTAHGGRTARLFRARGWQRAWRPPRFFPSPRSLTGAPHPAGGIAVRRAPAHTRPRRKVGCHRSIPLNPRRRRGAANVARLPEPALPSHLRLPVLFSPSVIPQAAGGRTIRRNFFVLVVPIQKFPPRSRPRATPCDVCGMHDSDVVPRVRPPSDFRAEPSRGVDSFPVRVRITAAWALLCLDSSLAFPHLFLVLPPLLAASAPPRRTAALLSPPPIPAPDFHEVSGIVCRVDESGEALCGSYNW